MFSKLFAKDQFGVVISEYYSRYRQDSAVCSADSDLFRGLLQHVTNQSLEQNELVIVVTTHHHTFKLFIIS